MSWMLLLILASAANSFSCAIKRVITVLIICFTNDHEYGPFVVIKITPFPQHHLQIIGVLTRVPGQVPLMNVIPGSITGLMLLNL